MRRNASNERRGGTAVEFALLLPVFIALLVGVFDYGWMIYGKAMLDSAIHLGCRQGSMIDIAESDPKAAAVAQIKVELARFGLACGGDCVFSTDIRGEPPAQTLVCSVTRNNTALIGLYPVPGTITSTTGMRLEFQR